MIIICSAVVVMIQLMGITYGNLIPLAVSLSKDLQAIHIKPVSSIGYIALALNTLCRIPVVDDFLTCAICHQDCIYIHNTYGGKCGPNPLNPKELTCLCAKTEEDAKNRGISLSSKKTCGAVPSVLGSVRDDTFRAVFLTRMRLLECPQYNNGTYEKSGCHTDCHANHGVTGGYCGVTYPLNRKTGTAKTLHCECKSISNVRCN